MKKSAARDAMLRGLGVELNKLLTASRAVAFETAASLDPRISASAIQILQWLHAFGPTKASALAEALSMDRSVVSRLAKELRKLGFLETTSDEADGRSVLYNIASLQRGRVADAIARKGSLFEKRVSKWTDADLVQLARLLGRLNEPVSRDIRSPEFSAQGSTRQ